VSLASLFSLVALFGPRNGGRSLFGQDLLEVPADEIKELGRLHGALGIDRAHGHLGPGHVLVPPRRAKGPEGFLGQGPQVTGPDAQGAQDNHQFPVRYPTSHSPGNPLNLHEKVGGQDQGVGVIEFLEKNGRVVFVKDGIAQAAHQVLKGLLANGGLLNLAEERQVYHGVKPPEGLHVLDLALADEIQGVCLYGVKEGRGQELVWANPGRPEILDE
jgi:hypothetical protein